MHPLILLQWFRRGEWHEIGWDATTPESAARLREHGQRLAEGGGCYRLISASIRRDVPYAVLHEFKPPDAAGEVAAVTS